MKNKIAIIDTLGAHQGSFHLYTFGQSMGLINSGLEVSLYTNNETSNPNIDRLRFFKFYNNIFKSKSKLINGARWIFGSIKSIFHARITTISIFHFHIFYANILILFNILLVKILLGKVVLTIHDVTSFANDQDSSYMSRLIYKWADLIITHNEFSKKEIQKRFYELASHIHIIPHGNYIPFINIATDKIKSREYLGVAQEKKILLFFGLIKEVKGLDVLLRSLKSVISQHPDTLLIIAGKAWKNKFSSYQEIIDSYNLNKYCIIHNRFISYNDVHHYYAAADLIVLPYKKIYQSGVLMMALSYKCAVLTSNLPPLCEVITDNENGFLFESENPESLAIKLNTILSERNNLEEVRVKGANLAASKYDWNHIGEATKKAYETII